MINSKCAGIRKYVESVYAEECLEPVDHHGVWECQAHVPWEPQAHQPPGDWRHQHPQVRAAQTDRVRSSACPHSRWHGQVCRACEAGNQAVAQQVSMTASRVAQQSVQEVRGVCGAHGGQDRFHLNSKRMMKKKLTQPRP